MLYAIAYALLTPIRRWIYRPIIEGADNLPQQGPVVLASNHLSVIDSVLIPLAAPRRIHYLAKADVFERHGLLGAFLRWLLSSLGAMPVRRGERHAAQAALDSALEVLNADRALLVYPEGTRSRDGRLYRGRTGVAWLALTAGCPVVPVGVEGTQHMMPVGVRFPRIRRVSVRFGEPVTFAADHERAQSARTRREVTEQIMTAIAELSRQQRADDYHQLPPGTAA